MRNFFCTVALLATAPLLTAASNSRPQPVPIVDTIPAARDIPYPGVMRLKVDATDLDRAIFKVEQTIPVAAAGRMTLLFPEWLPGNHAPRGQVDKLAGLEISGGGKPLRWVRDPADVYAFHVDVPAGVRTIEARFLFLSATAPDQGRVVVTPEMLNIQWESVSLYPAGYYTRQIPVIATLTLPAGWKAATALRPTATNGTTLTYGQVDYEVLQDSPVFAGKYFRRDDLGSGVTLNTIADDPKLLAAPADVIQKHRNLVTQALKLFGARHFDHYDFLHALTERLGGIGLEHHRSSENQNEPTYFTAYKDNLSDHNLLPHEFVHSWDGKFRRGADLWTPDFRTPMRNSMLWVYEGQTQFWGYVLEARSGMSTKAEVLDKLASIAANLDNLPARQWRPLIDTTNDPIISARRPKGWLSFQRNEDYYNEGLLIWTEADAIIRQGTNGARGMDDFARAFFGINDGDWGQVTYTLDEVVKTLNGVYAYDWRSFLDSRVYQANDRAPLAGFTRSGYTLTYTDTPSEGFKALAKASKTANFAYSLGFNVGTGDKIASVLWGSPAFNAGLTIGQQVMAVNGRTYSEERLKDAVTAAKTSKAPIRLSFKRGEELRDVSIAWTGGLRYPRFVKTGKGDGPLDRLLAPR